ncbi:MAG: N-acetylmuramoyl-L-alanine amidase [Planctomycetaceae bacterium]|nr:MAG: N-acetylmuramoyl-L-alanine amidase [Planctomycetaceae bacterium]
MDDMKMCPRVRVLPLGKLTTILLVASAFLAAGCDPQTGIKDHDVITLPGRTTVTDMAHHLGLLVVGSKSDSVILKNSANTVVIYADPAGQAYVNGMPVGSMGGYIVIDNKLFVPDDIEAQIKAAMRPTPSRTHVNNQTIIKPIDNTGLSPKLGKVSVVIDAGHGGKDPGAIVGGRSEKDINLAIATNLAAALRSRGVQVVMTRDKDVFIELDDRVEIANTSGAKLFVSIHSDSSADKTDCGHTVIMPNPPSSAASALANEISRSMVASGSILHSVRNDNRGLRVLKYTKIPAVLIEMGFMSNARDAARLTDPTYQESVADGIADGIVTYLNQKK